MMNNSGLAGKTALVTGGSRGIGRAVSLALAAEGVAVAINYVANDEAAEETRTAVAAQGIDCHTYKADVSDAGQVNRMIEAIEADLGPVDLLVTNAGYGALEEHGKLSFETWRWMMSVNADGTFLPVAALASGMAERGYGRIVCVASIAALRARPALISYSAAKAAVISFARSCSEVFAPNVRINCVAPGLIDTDLGSEVGPDASAKMIAATPLKRIGQPEEIADAVVFLLSDRSSYISGQTLAVSGGRVTVP
ncbi:MAG: SDR family oxidoreductase [Rhodospirillales bacterium]|jgi:3-oxoacyl-[acyl-carrier protein] reductase|nr:SDR family oxidoreductase [Rhodospirillales bacterium]